MIPSPISPAKSPAPSPFEGWAVAVLFLISALLFVPALLWVLDRTLQSGQLLHAFLVMVFAAAFLLWDRKERLTPEFTFSTACWRRLCLAFLLLVPGLWVRGPWLVFPAMCCALSGWTVYLFGPRAQKLSDMFFGVFGLYLGLLLFFPTLDWPLRMLAGKGAALALQAIGFEAELFQMLTHRDVLILAVNQRPFEVAAECNGFGLMSSAGLLALIFFSVSRLPWVLKAAAFPLGIGLGLLFNMLRIVLICLLAPLVGDSYKAMHEIIGASAFWGCLLAIRRLSLLLEDLLGTRGPSASA